MQLFKSLFALVGLLFCFSQANAQSYQQVVQTSGSGDKVFLEINLPNLQESMDSIFSNLSVLSSFASSVSWGDVLENGSNPGMDINFNSYDIQGLGNLTATGTLNADSLTLNKDADITGSLSVTDVVDFGDSLSVTGYVLFSDSLQVVKAVTIGETLFVTGVTSLGDSLHVSGNVDLDALFNVDGAATFGSTMVVTGKTTLNDSLHVNSGANITGTLEVDGETTLNDSLHVNASVDVAGDLSVGGEFQAASLRADSSIAQGGSASNYNTVALGASSVASGIGAVAAGYGTSAAGVQSTAIGTNASASGINAVAIGEGAQASAVQAVAVGKNAKVSSDYASTAVGMNSEVTVGWGQTALGGGKVNPSAASSSQNMAFGASTISTEGSYNISMGYYSTISGNGSTTGSMTFGPSSTVSGGYRNMTFGAGASISGSNSNSNYAMGDYSSVSGGAWHAYALGNNSKVQANGHHAFAFGPYSEVSAYNAANFAFMTPARFSHQAIFGAYADTTQMVPVSGSHNDWIGSDPLFVVANGATESTRSNALIIRKDGAAMFSDSLHVAGHVTMADQLTVTGATTLNDSLHVNSGVNITGDVVVNDTNLLQIIASLEARIAALEAGTPSASFTCGTSTVTFDGHDYNTVEIGAQCWFAENLRTTKYADGSSIAEVTDNSVWTSTNDGARAAYNNDASNLTNYGYLYNWYAVNNAAGLCPTDWHVPTDEEWTALTTELGGESVAGNKMKSSSTDSPSWDGNNSSGFSALPGGLRSNGSGSFFNEGNFGYWWSASPFGSSSAWYRLLFSASDNVDRSSNYLRLGFSVRCLRDE